MPRRAVLLQVIVVCTWNTYEPVSKEISRRNSLTFPGGFQPESRLLRIPYSSRTRVSARLQPEYARGGSPDCPPQKNQSGRAPAAGRPSAALYGRLLSPLLSVSRHGLRQDAAPTRIGEPLGLGAPPEGSTVTASAFAAMPDGNRSSNTSPLPLESGLKVPAGIGLPSTGMTQSS